MIQNLIGLFLFIMVLPIILFACLLIIIFDRQNPIYIQERIGLNKKPFQMIKLSTIKNEKVTKIGYYLRKYYINELPQFLNVFIGNMAIIGPRPLLKSDYTNDDFYSRTIVLPGCAGYQQIHGRMNSLEDKMPLDMYYINNKSLIFDIEIFFRTIHVILRGTGK